MQLSTPHGALGTALFNLIVKFVEILSTPHGALGTPNDHINQNKTYQSLCQEGTPFK